MPEYDYTITADGGVKGQGQRGPKKSYGSYQLTTRSGKSRIVSLEFGSSTRTSNEAEYDTMLCAISTLQSIITKAGQPTQKYSLLAKTDSKLMVQQVNGVCKTKARNLKGRRRELVALLANFEDGQLEWTTREEVVKALGH